MRRCDSPTLTLFQCLQRVKRSTFFWDLHTLQTLPACLLAWANGCSLDRTSQTIRQEVVAREIESGNNGFKATPEYGAAFRHGEGGGDLAFLQRPRRSGARRDQPTSAPPLGAPLHSGRCQDTNSQMTSINSSCGLIVNVWKTSFNYISVHVFMPFWG